MLKFGTGGQVVPLGFDLWPREKCPKDFNFSPKVTIIFIKLKSNLSKFK